MQALAKAGFVNAQRGRGKVSTLARPAREISVADVVRCFEAFDLAECFREGPGCRLTGRCKLEASLKKARDAFLRSLEGTSLHSLRSPQTKSLVPLGNAAAK